MALGQRRRHPRHGRLADGAESDREIAFRPARVLMQDFTGVPAVVDLAAMRDAMRALGGDPERINPLVPVDLVIDHSVIVDAFGNAARLRQKRRARIRAQRRALPVPPLGRSRPSTISASCRRAPASATRSTSNTSRRPSCEPRRTDATVAYPDTLVGTDSHTTMVNGLAVLGWGVGGIEAEAAMLGQPISMLIPEVVGFRLTGKLREGVTATDLVLTVTQMLRKKGVVGKFVEFYGPGLDNMALEDRATIGNMAPEYGATCGYFPIDAETIRYLAETGREPERVALVEAYARAQGLLRESDSPTRSSPTRSSSISTPSSRRWPGRSGRRTACCLPTPRSVSSRRSTASSRRAARSPSACRSSGADFDIGHGDVVIAAITSCTNTSNPSVMIGAGLLARNALAKGLKTKPWVKTSLAPGSQVVGEYLAKSGLQADLDQLGFNLVGYGCTTCIGNSGPLPEPISEAIGNGDLVAAAVLSGNRNFEGRINPDVRANYLASPPLVVAYALAGSMQIDLVNEPLGTDKDGKPVYLRDIWPSTQEIAEFVRAQHHARIFRAGTPTSSRGDEQWQGIKVEGGLTYSGIGARPTSGTRPISRACSRSPGRSPTSSAPASSASSAIRSPPTTSRPPARSATTSPAGGYLLEHQVRPADFNSYGARRGNHEVMMRGTFANIRIRNQMVAGRRRRRHQAEPDGAVMSIYDAAMRYKPRACRWWSSPARNTAPARRATGRRRARACSACARSSPRASSASTAPTSSAWACCRSCSRRARRGGSSASRATRPSPSAASRAGSSRARSSRPRSPPPTARSSSSR